MKIKKVRKQEIVTIFHDQPKSYILLLFFLSELTVSALLNFYSLFLLHTSSYCIKKSILEQMRTHNPYFY